MVIHQKSQRLSDWLPFILPSSPDSCPMSLLGVPEMEAHIPVCLPLQVPFSLWNATPPPATPTPRLGPLSPARSRDSFPSFNFSSLKAWSLGVTNHCEGGQRRTQEGRMDLRMRSYIDGLRRFARRLLGAGERKRSEPWV